MDTGIYSGLDIAKYVINRCKNYGKPVSNLHLQKILYFLQGEYFNATNTWLIKDDFLAWQYGPVLQDVYDEYSWYYSSLIYEDYDIQLTCVNKEIIDSIIDEKRKKTAGQLVEESHKIGGAWQSCHNGLKSTVIPKDLIKNEFYKVKVR